jgi:cation diffusion facilitator CzcD-associated flavoprotein CzcO
METIDTLVVGAGQAGIAMSEHLGRPACRIWCWSAAASPSAGAARAGIRW